MEVLDPCSVLLCDWEVLDLVRSKADAMHTTSAADTAAASARLDIPMTPSKIVIEAATTTPQNVMTILYEVKSYLNTTPCQVQSAEEVRKFLTKLLPYELTKAEKLGLLNQRPDCEPVLLSIIDDGEERFTDEQRQKLQAIVDSLPEPPEPEATGEEEEEALETEEMETEEMETEEMETEEQTVEGGMEEHTGEQAIEPTDWVEGDDEVGDYDEGEAYPEDDFVNEADKVNSDGERD